MSEETYNGWTNWDTWNAKLWLDNEQWTAKEAYSCGAYLAPRGIERLKYLVLHCTQAVTGDGVDMENVNWEEIFESYEEEWDEDHKEEEDEDDA
jgi:hypothetical protein